MDDDRRLYKWMAGYLIFVTIAGITLAGKWRWIGDLDSGGWQAVGTIGAVMVALGFGIFAEVRLRRERLESYSYRRAMEGRQESAQASRVHAWITATTQQKRNNAVALHPRLTGYVHNGSEGPIFDILISVGGAKLVDGEIRFDILLPAHTAEAVFEFDAPRADGAMTVWFRDSGVRRWVRDDTGYLDRAFRPNEQH